ncbi:hypothetical protein GGR45_000243 [Sphingomonas zeae]|jgi:hypothetical protein|nr:hypothetical protein [Sphingomonas zeae]
MRGIVYLKLGMGGGPFYGRRRLWLALPRPLPLAGGEQKGGSHLC